MPFEFERLQIPDVILVKPRVFPDGRGFFMETYRRSDFVAAGISGEFVQDNNSRSTKGVLRGLHYQMQPTAQGKLVRVLFGRVFDVAVDLRKGAPTYGKWVGVTLSAENRQMVYVPPWCAHGFCVLSEEAEVEYKATNEYAPEHEAGIIWNDPDVGIEWPVRAPILSARDRSWPSLSQAENNFEYLDRHAGLSPCQGSRAV